MTNINISFNSQCNNCRWLCFPLILFERAHTDRFNPVSNCLLCGNTSKHHRCCSFIEREKEINNDHYTAKHHRLWLNTYCKWGMVMVLSATFNNNSAISWRLVWIWIPFTFDEPKTGIGWNEPTVFRTLQVTMSSRTQARWLIFSGQSFNYTKDDKHEPHLKPCVKLVFWKGKRFLFH
jgi:hypothetical protein